MRIAPVQPELTNKERKLEYYFDLLKENHLDENTPITELVKCIDYFQVTNA